MDQHSYIRLVDEGHGTSAIVLPSRATEVERFAARELAKYLHLMSGAAVPTVLGKPERSSLPTVYIGSLTTPDDTGFPRPDRVPNDPEGFIIRTEAADTLLLIGSEPVGALYAVYALLTDVLGVSFVGLGERGDEVPIQGTIDIPAIDRADKPTMRRRSLNTLSNENDVAVRPMNAPALVSPLMIDRLDWMAKHRLNTLLIQASAFDVRDVETHLVPEATKRGIDVEWSHHNMGTWLPWDRYGAKHPEYYAVRDAVRTNDRASQFCLCTSNPAVAYEVARNIAQFRRDHPWAHTVGLWPNDGYGSCECDACAKLDRYSDEESREVAFYSGTDEAIPLTAIDRNKTNRYVRFLNDVAERLVAEQPDARLSALFYVDVIRPAPDEPLHPAIDPMIALYWRCSAHALFDDSCPTNQWFASVVREWLDYAPGRVSFYEYYMGMDEYASLPFPIVDALRSDWQAYAGGEDGVRGITGASIQSAASHHTAYGLNYALFAALAWDPNTDVDAFLDRWFEASYGPAARVAGEWWSALMNQMSDIAAGEGPDTHDANRPSCYTPVRLNFPALWDETCMARIGGMLDGAIGTPGMSHGQSARLDDLRTYHVYCVASNEAYRRELDARQYEANGGILNDRKAALARAVVEGIDRLAEFTEHIDGQTIIFTKRIRHRLATFRRMWTK